MTALPCGSLLLTAVGCDVDSLDIDSVADCGGHSVMRIVDLGEDVTVASAMAARPAGPIIVVGTGTASFDGRVAAAMGLPHLIVTGTSSAVTALCIRESVATGAQVAGPIPASSFKPDFVSEELAKLPGAITPLMGPEVFERWLKTRAKENRRHIVLPEGEDDRILYAAADLLADNVCELTILGNPAAMAARAKELGLDLTGAHLDDPTTSTHLEEFAQDFYQLRKAKGMTEEKARETMQDISYFATMMIHKGLADGMVSGAAHTTAHTIKPSFQIIKTKPGVRTVSSLFLMVLQGKIWGFGDCAVNPNPTSEQLAEIAVVSAETARQFGLDPKVALLSYSTGTSGSGPDVDRVAAAAQVAHTLDKDLAVDGPLQFDAAVDPGVAAKKAPDSAVAGNANVFIFPDLEAGNICYKAVQRTSGALAVGPILQGLKKPVNDLSRGATVADIINTVAITAIQAQGE